MFNFNHYHMKNEILKLKSSAILFVTILMISGICIQCQPKARDLPETTEDLWEQVNITPVPKKMMLTGREVKRRQAD